MSIKPRFDTYRYIGEVCRLRAQSVVECRLPGSEISSILAVYAQAIPVESGCLDGEVRYSGRLLLNVVYEDGDKKVCRAERGAEFFHKAEGSEVTPSCFAKTALKTENVNWRREGSGLYLSVVIGADVAVYGNRQMEYLSGGEQLVCKKQGIAVCKTLCVTGETEGEDEFESDYVGDILMHSEGAIAHRVEARGGGIEIEGELALNICVLKRDEGVCSYERIVPFKMQVPCDEAFGKTAAEARICVKSAHLTVDTDEEKGKSKIVFSYCLSADCFVYVLDEVEVAEDAFCKEQVVHLHKERRLGRYITKTLKCVERVSGEAAVSPVLEGEYMLQAAVLPRVEMSVKKNEYGKAEAEGAVLADVLLCGADGVHRSAALSLPFLFPVDIEGDSIAAECLVCGLNVRRKRSGETEAEATLKLCLKGYTEGAWEYIDEVREGEKIEETDSAFSVFIPCAGESKWELAKRLRCTIEELEKSNPDLEFPICEGERIYVYRQVK